MPQAEGRKDGGVRRGTGAQQPQQQQSQQQQRKGGAPPKGGSTSAPTSSRRQQPAVPPSSSPRSPPAPSYASAAGGGPNVEEAGTPRGGDRSAAFLTEPEPGDAVGALAEEVERLRGIHEQPASAEAAEAERQARAEASLAGRPSGPFVVGGRRSVGGIWMSVADEARVEALLAESDGIGEGSDVCPDGEGYLSCAEDAARMREIDGVLQQLAESATLVDQALTPHQSQSLPSSAGAEEGTSLGASRVSRLDSEGGGGHSEQYDDYLGQMKLQREQSSALERVRNRLAALHTVASDAPATGAEERQRLDELLAAVRNAAEREVRSRPATSASTTVSDSTSGHPSSGRELELLQ
jgi:hypothetical protein